MQTIDVGSTRIPLPTIENAIRGVCQAIDRVGNRMPVWERMTEDDLWRELVACILGSRTRFEDARAALERMDEAGLLSKKRRSSGFREYERDVMHALQGSGALSRPAPFKGTYPFSRLRSGQIREAAEMLYAQGGTIRRLLDSSGNTLEARRRLAGEVAGMGPKQASLFLRNTGYAPHVAVLDVHLLTYMNWVGLTPTPITSVSTLRQYETLEDALMNHACAAGYPPDRFDLAVWVVVRVVKRGV